MVHICKKKKKIRLSRTLRGTRLRVTWTLSRSHECTNAKIYATQASSSYTAHPSDKKTKISTYFTTAQENVYAAFPSVTSGVQKSGGGCGRHLGKPVVGNGYAPPPRRTPQARRSAGAPSWADRPAMAALVAGIPAAIGCGITRQQQFPVRRIFLQNILGRTLPVFVVSDVHAGLLITLYLYKNFQVISLFYFSKRIECAISFCTHTNNRCELLRT